MKLTTRLFPTVCAAIVACTGALASQTATNTNAATLSEFTERVGKYVALRNEADNGSRPLKKTDDPAKIRMAQQELAHRIAAARAGAKPGDIFTPAIATHFRRLLRPESKEPGTRAAMKDDDPKKVPFKINGSYPDGEALGTVPPNVLASLPKLPEDVEYRFVGKHMLLRDARANLIIDYMLDALP
jgi:hypothetical protein